MIDDVDELQQQLFEVGQVNATIGGPWCYQVKNSASTSTVISKQDSLLTEAIDVMFGNNTPFDGSLLVTPGQVFDKPILYPLKLLPIGMWIDLLMNFV